MKFPKNASLKGGGGDDRHAREDEITEIFAPTTAYCRRLCHCHSKADRKYIHAHVFVKLVMFTIKSAENNLIRMVHTVQLSDMKLYGIQYLSCLKFCRGNSLTHEHRAEN